MKWNESVCTIAHSQGTCAFTSFVTRVDNNGDFFMRGFGFCQRGSNPWRFFFLLFLIDKGVSGQRIQITLKVGNHRPTNERRFAGGPKMVQLWMLALYLWFSRGSGSLLLWKPIFLTPCPPLDPHMILIEELTIAPISSGTTHHSTCVEFVWRLESCNSQMYIHKFRHVHITRYL